MKSALLILPPPALLGVAALVGYLRLARGYFFSDLPDFAVLLEPFDPAFILGLATSTAASRISALCIREARRALCVALRWLARRFISLDLFVPRI